MKGLTCAEALAVLPQRPPMRFVNAITELDEDHVVGTYTWTEEDCAGHFPGNPIVPGIKLLECAAQLGIVAWGMYHLSLTLSREELAQHVGLFTRVEGADFKRVVRPGDTIVVTATFGEEGYFRGNKILTAVEGVFVGGPQEGETAFEGLLAGMAIPRRTLERGGEAVR